MKSIGSVGSFATSLLGIGGSFVGNTVSNLSASDFLKGYQTTQAMEAATRVGQTTSEEHQYNANVFLQQAEVERAWAGAEALRMKRQARRARSKHVASHAASGIVANTGSVLDVLYDDTFEAVLDQQTVIAQGEVRARYLEASAGLETRKASTSVSNARDTVLAQAVGGFGGILAGNT